MFYMLVTCRNNLLVKITNLFERLGVSHPSIPSNNCLNDSLSLVRSNRISFNCGCLLVYFRNPLAVISHNFWEGMMRMKNAMEHAGPASGSNFQRKGRALGNDILIQGSVYLYSDN